MVIGVAGCVAQAEGQSCSSARRSSTSWSARRPIIACPSCCTGGRARRRARYRLPRSESKFDRLPEELASPPGVSAFLTVQEGCDKFCTFCVVPYTRGAEASRPAAAILAEARRLIDAGAREIIAARPERQRLPRGGTRRAALEPGPADPRRWPKSMTSRASATPPRIPRDVSADLVEAHGGIAKLMPFLHLPVQSGADAVLQAMNRRHTADDYRRIVQRLRAARPDLALSSDFIVGFPGETDRDFEATLALVEEIGFAQAFSFKYSARPGTPAAGMRKQIADRSRASVWRACRRCSPSRRARSTSARSAGSLPVLLERPGHHPGQLVGRTPYLQAVHVEAAGAVLGEIIDVLITRATPTAWPRWRSRDAEDVHCQGMPIHALEAGAAPRRRRSCRGL